MRRALAIALPCVMIVAGDASAAEPLDAKTIDVDIAQGRIGGAVVRCEEAIERVGDAGLPSDLRASCGRALVLLGDRLAQAGSPDNARKRWLQAVEVDPRLLDDPAFAKKLEAGQTPKPDPKVEPKPDPKVEPKPDPKVEPKPDPKPDPKPIVVERPKEPRRKTPPGPRHDRSLGLGLSVGFDGVLALDIGWLVDEHWLIEVAFGIVYPTADARFRWLGMRSCVTPYIGAGLLVPFGASDRFDLDLSGFRALYELGEAVHVDLGLAWTPVHSLDIYLGVAFLTPFDQDHPDTVVFFPQLSGGVSWYF
ncbi:MAG: hypothetical protein IT385_19255 [Deltaproteobacteria bacterium]|nr:hypothetical protein [Deltaproteobacteria bacterium]